MPWVTQWGGNGPVPHGQLVPPEFGGVPAEAAGGNGSRDGAGEHLCTLPLLLAVGAELASFCQCCWWWWQWGQSCQGGHIELPQTPLVLSVAGTAPLEHAYQLPMLSLTPVQVHPV